MTKENDLIHQWQETGNFTVRNTIVMAHMDSLKALAKSLPTYYLIEKEELVTEGLEGMIEALNHYRGREPFLLFATPYARKRMVDFIIKNLGNSYRGETI